MGQCGSIGYHIAPCREHIRQSRVNQQAPRGNSGAFLLSEGDIYVTLELL